MSASRGRLLVLVLVEAGCARSNPAFDAAQDATDSAGQTDAGATTRPGLTSASDDGKPPPNGDADGTGASGATATSGATEPAASDDVTQPATSDTGRPLCEYTPTLAAFAVDVHDANGNAIDLACGKVREIVGPLQSLAAGELTMLDCAACGACTGDVIAVSISGAELDELPAPSAPACVRVQIATGAEGDCAPEVLLVSEALGVGTPPEIIVTNLRDPPLLRALVPPTPELVDDAGCEVACENDRVPGEHALAFDNGSAVDPGTTVSGVALETFTADVQATYDIRLRFGGIDGDCREHFGWTAVRVPG